MYESWTHNKSDIKLNGYESFNFYRRFQNRRANRCSGGIVLYLKDSISDGLTMPRCHSTSCVIPRYTHVRNNRAAIQE